MAHYASKLLQGAQSGWVAILGNAIRFVAVESRVKKEPIMRTILVGVVVLSPLIIVLLGTHAQGGARSLRDLLQAPAGHRQTTVQNVQDIQENSSADQAMKKIDEDLKKKLQGICRGC